MKEREAKAKEIRDLQDVLFSSLNESFFFSKLSLFLKEKAKADRVDAYKAVDNTDARLVCSNSKPKLGRNILTSGPTVSVIRSKKAYFCNDLKKDPLFSAEARKGFKRVLIVPIIYKNMVLGTVNLQRLANEKPFSKNDITRILSLLSHFKRPFANMSLYLSAKSLNESLAKQIRRQEDAPDEGGDAIFTDRFAVVEDDIVGTSAVMREAVSLGDKYARSSDTNVLIEGERSSGKSLISKRIHCRSERADKGYAVIDCASTKKEKLRKELFGYEVVESSGEIKIVKGLVELLDGGTLLLRNVDRMDMDTQEKLVRFLEHNTATREGTNESFRSHVRILSTCRTSLRSRVRERRFKEKLYYRLATLCLDVPPLRERTEDVAMLAKYFLNHKRGGKVSKKTFSDKALEALVAYSWPSNVGELQNVVDRAHAMSEGMVVRKLHLIFDIDEKEIDDKDIFLEADDRYYEMTLSEIEKRHIRRILNHQRGNKTRTAQTLGITLKTLYSKLYNYGIAYSK